MKSNMSEGFTEFLSLQWRVRIAAIKFSVNRISLKPIKYSHLGSIHRYNSVSLFGWVIIKRNRYSLLGARNPTFLGCGVDLKNVGLCRKYRLFSAERIKKTVNKGNKNRAYYKTKHGSV